MGNSINDTYKIGITAEEHENSLKLAPKPICFRAPIGQRSKTTGGNERLGVYQNHKLVAVASILIQPLPLGFTMLYIPRGPIMDYQNSELVASCSSPSKHMLKQACCLRQVWSLSFPKKGLIGQETSDQEATLAIIQSLKECGVEWVGRTEDMGETIQPRFQANIYKEYFTEDQLSKSTNKPFGLLEIKELKSSLEALNS